jgi:predicted PurR-regulated permease PerM
MNKSGLIIFGLVVLLLFLYSVRSILSPFVLAIVFAYIFTPIVDRLQRSTKIPRVLIILGIYLFLLAVIFYVVFLFGSAAFGEIKFLTENLKDLNSFKNETLHNLPEWKIAGQHLGLRSVAETILSSLTITASRLNLLIIPAFKGTIGKILSSLIFLVASFYLVKDAPHITGALKSRIPKKYSEDVKKLAKAINDVLSGYLRGQVILIILMASATSITLSILGIKFALILGILTGFLELIPFVGPIAVASLAAIIAFLTGTNNFGLQPVPLAALVLFIYFVLRQVEDYLIVPQVVGNLTKLHPLVVMFSVLAGGTIAGPLGFVLAVPVAASVKILLEYSWEKIQ